ncbi:hypothetical protein NMG60_11015875 [Bertholletia excelsa]
MWGWKKLPFKPLVAILHAAAVTDTTHKIMPEQPRNRLNHHDVLFCGGFLIKGNVIPPIRAPRFGKNGKATDIKNAIPPKKIRMLKRSHHGHGFFFLTMYLNSNFEALCTFIFLEKAINISPSVAI